MGNDFYHSDMQLFIDQRVDWGRYVQLKRGPEVNPGEEVATYRAILQTIGEVREAIGVEPAAGLRRLTARVGGRVPRR